MIRLPGLVLALALGLLITLPARASGPALVDDAGVVAPGQCELEAYGNVALATGWRAVVSPTCGFRGLRGWEIGVIVAADGPGGKPIPGASMKAALIARGPLTLGAELSAGFDPEGNSGDYAASNLSATLALLKALTIHANAGLDHAPGLGVFPTWGLGVGLEVRSGLWLLAESAGRRGFRTRWQAGVRHITGPWQFDALISHAIDDARGGSWLTLGVMYSFDR